MKRVAVIMAGGAGERFWPLSRANYPKQLLKIAGDRSMLMAAVERVIPVAKAEDVFVITGTTLKPAIERELPIIPRDNVIAEPEGKNTAACLALASAFLDARFAGEDVTTIVLTADHFISDIDAFRRDLELGCEVAEADPCLVTFGMVPDRPETGYGYIELGEPLAGRPTSAIADRVFRVSSFREKPSAEIAEQFVSSGRFLWNSGMFIWRNSTIRAAFQEHLPRTGEQIESMAEAYQVAKTASSSGTGEGSPLARIFSGLEKISIDVGVLERATNVAVVKAGFDWDDIGTWSALRRLIPADTAGNVTFGKGVAIDSRNTIIYNVDVAPANAESPASATASQPRIAVAFGLDNIIVVNTPDAILVLPADKVQGVKDVVAHLRQNDLGEHL